MKLITFLACIVLLYKISEAYYLPFIRKLSHGTGWPGTCSNGIRQSPIDISSNRARYDYFLRELLISSTNTAEEWKVENTGSGITLEPTGKKFSFIAFPEREEYELEEINLRWRGSEHLINGERYAAELQLTHRSKVSPAKRAIISFLFRETNRDNIRLESILASVNDVKSAVGEVDTTSIVLNQIIPTRLRKYYRYSGSLTVQPCDESVEWFIIEDPIMTISTKQLLALQQVKDSTGNEILTNSRPIQSLNGRIVRKSFNGFSNSNPNYSPFSHKKGYSQNGYDSYRNQYADHSHSKFSKMNQVYGSDRYFDRPYPNSPAYEPYQSPSYSYSSHEPYGHQASPSPYRYDSPSFGPSYSYDHSSDSYGYHSPSYGYQSDSYDYSSPSYRSHYPSYGYPSDSYGYGSNEYSNEPYDFNIYSTRKNLYSHKYDYQNDYKEDYASSQRYSDLENDEPANMYDSFYHDYFNNNYNYNYKSNY